MSKIYKPEELIRGSGAKTEYYVPKTDKWVNNKCIGRYLESIGMTIEYYYNLYFLGIDDPDYRPKCANPECNNLVRLGKISRGYYNSCSSSCQSKTNWNNPEFRAKEFANNPTHGPNGLMGYIKSNQELYDYWKTRSPGCQPGGVHYYLLNNNYKNYIDFMKQGGVFGMLYRSGRDVSSSYLYYQHGDYESPKCSGIIHYRSSYELRYLKILDNDDTVESFEYEKLYLPYEYEGKSHRYIVDFIVHYKDGTTKLKEVKPSYFLKDEIVLLKAEAGRKYAAEHGIEYEFVTESDLRMLETDEDNISSILSNIEEQDIKNINT